MRRITNMSSAWVIRNKDNGLYWNGFGFTDKFHEARMYPTPPDATVSYFHGEILEVRTIYRESDKEN